MLSAAQNPIDSEMSPAVSYKPMENDVGFTSKASSAPVPSQPNYVSVERAGAAQPQQRLISDIDDMAARSQSQWLRPSGPLDYNSVSSDVLSEQEELTIGEGTINLSTVYSQKYVLFQIRNFYFLFLSILNFPYELS